MSFSLRRVSIVLVLGTSAAACTPQAGTDMFDPQFLQTHAIAGRTTEQDILHLYGPPSSRYLVSGSFEALNYENKGTPAGSSNLLQSAAGYLVPSASTAFGAMSAPQSTKTSKRVAFFFRPDGVLKDYTLSD